MTTFAKSSLKCFYYGFRSLFKAESWFLNLMLRGKRTPPSSKCKLRESDLGKQRTISEITASYLTSAPLFLLKKLLWIWLTFREICCAKCRWRFFLIDPIWRQKHEQSKCFHFPHLLVEMLAEVEFFLNATLILSTSHQHQRRKENNKALKWPETCSRAGLTFCRGLPLNKPNEIFRARGEFIFN